MSMEAYKELADQINEVGDKINALTSIGHSLMSQLGQLFSETIESEGMLSQVWWKYIRTEENYFVLEACEDTNRNRLVEFLHTDALGGEKTVRSSAVYRLQRSSDNDYDVLVLINRGDSLLLEIHADHIAEVIDKYQLRVFTHEFSALRGAALGTSRLLEDVIDAALDVQRRK